MWKNEKFSLTKKIFRQINSLVTYKQNRYFHGISLTLISVTPKEKGVAFRCYYFYFPKYFCYSKLKLYLDFVFHTIFYQKQATSCSYGKFIQTLTQVWE